MLLVTGVRDNGSKVIIVDTDDMVLKAIRKEEYLDYLLNGGYIGNLDPGCNQYLNDNRDKLDRIGVSILVDTYAILWDGKPDEIYLNHSMRDISAKGFRATSKDGMFYFKHSENGAVALICEKTGRTY